jgi:hypothetical protein
LPQARARIDFSIKKGKKKKKTHRAEPTGDFDMVKRRIVKISKALLVWLGVKPAFPPRASHHLWRPEGGKDVMRSVALRDRERRGDTVKLVKLSGMACIYVVVFTAPPPSGGEIVGTTTCGTKARRFLATLMNFDKQVRQS